MTRDRIRLQFTLVAGLILVATTSLASPPDHAKTPKAVPAMLVHYRFEDAGARPVKDDSGNNREGTIGGEPASPESAFPALGKATRVDADRWIRVPDLGSQDAITIEMWVKPARPETDIAGLYATDTWKTGSVHLNLRAGGGVEFAINGVGRFPISEPDTLPVGRWVHLVAAYDRKTGEMSLYANGRRVLRADAESQPAIKLTTASIGAWLVGGKATRSLEAAIDEFAIYPAALTAEQVRKRYLTAKGVNETPVDFARDVRPILADACFRCHGEKQQKAGLRLDVRDAALRGGESGEPSIERFDADASEMVRRITAVDDAEAMPPGGKRLGAKQIATLRSWIDQGAAWPDALAGSLQVKPVATKHWSFQPVTKPAVPKAGKRGSIHSNPIDAFVVAKLSGRGLSLSPEADRVTLIRRLYLDVLGLPPTPEEIDAFVQDMSPDAWDKLVDRVLASPHYGERLASHWLDVIRYGDTHGFEVNTPRDNAWPYRDWVIRSFNEDRPYDQFIREQVAGDQFGADAATGFLVAAPAVMPGQVGKDEPSKRQARSDELNEILVSVGSGVLGLTIACARCHDHKFDPVSQQDYYKFAAVFSGVKYGDRALRNAAGVRLDAKVPLAKAVYAGRFVPPPPTRRLYRGDPMQPRERVAPDVPAVFGTLGLESTAPESERRLAIANWLTDPKNPLTARVIVNRVWQHRFGTGIVATPSDFGGLGSTPTHPELLDWLAATLVEDGWSLKKLTRRILLSRTYRQSSTPPASGLAADRDARLLWRFPPRRLDMEPIRDSILAAAGTLDPTMGGPGFMLFKPNSNYVRVYDPKDEWGPAEWRRMIYAHRVRMARDGVFGPFDCPDAGQPAPVRGRSTTAIQALALLNSSFVRQQAEKLADRVKREAGADVEAQVTRAFRLALGREPTAEQLAASVEVAKEHGVATVALALFNSNEFLFLP